MSPTILTERTEAGTAVSSVTSRLPSDEVYDTDFIKVHRVQQPTNRKGYLNRLRGCHERRSGRVVYFGLDQRDESQLVGIRMAGSCLEDVKFETFDSTGIDTRGLTLWAAELALGGELVLGSGSRSRRLVEFEVEDVDQEPITADFDRPIDGAWLVATFDAIFAPVTEEDVELDFDPDDYPVI